MYDTEVAPRLGAGQHYLDFTGTSLYLNSQVDAASQELLRSVYGNPHSVNPASARTTKLVDDLRADLLEFFNADPDDYQLVFVRSATGGLQMLGESFPWHRGGSYKYMLASHNSVLGIREYATKLGASFVGSVTEEDVLDWLGSGDAQDDDQTNTNNNNNSSSTTDARYSLFAFPAKDNYSGVLYPLSWIKAIQNKSTKFHKWFVLLDAAAFVPTHRLDLTQYPADFIAISFYKLFGLPTGVGAWIIRRSAAPFLLKTYWGGGSVFTATASYQWKIRHVGHDRWEDGTLPFLNIMALRHGLREMERLGGIDAVEDHVHCVGTLLSEELRALQHSNGRPLVRLFGRHGNETEDFKQGATANFLILKPDGQEVFSYKTASVELADGGFHVREGCMCVPGICYASLGLKDEEVAALAESKHDDFSDWEWIRVERGGQEVTLPLGTIRVSLGWMSRVQDVDALVGFLLRNYRDRTDDALAPELREKYAHVFSHERNKGAWPQGC